MGHPSNQKSIFQRMLVISGTVSLTGALLGYLYYSTYIGDILFTGVIFSLVASGLYFMSHPPIIRNVHTTQKQSLPFLYDSNWELNALKDILFQSHKILTNKSTYIALSGVACGLLLGVLYYQTGLFNMIFIGVMFSIMFIGMELLYESPITTTLSQTKFLDTQRLHDALMTIKAYPETLTSGFGFILGLIAGQFFFAQALTERWICALSFSVTFVGLEMLYKSLKKAPKTAPQTIS